MPSAEAPPELRLLAALEGAVRASDARAAGGLLADPSLQAPMRRVAERLHQLVDPRLHSFVLPAPALRRTAPAPRPPPASEGPPSAPSREPRGGEGAWPAPRHADWLDGGACPVVACGGAPELPAAAVDHIAGGHPCILRGLALFPAACERWSFEYLADHLSLERLSVFSSCDGDYSYWYGKGNAGGFDFDPPTARRTCFFREFLREREASAMESGGGGHLYLQDVLWKHTREGKPQLRREAMSGEMLHDWDAGLSWETLRQALRAGGFSNLSTSSLFCSGRGAYSRLHYDQNANLYLQVRGAKRWLIFPPECGPMLYPYPKGHPLDRKARLDPEDPRLDLFPSAAELRGRGLVATLRPGDVLWLPSHWWHAVQSLEEETLSLNFWFNPPASAAHFPPDHADVELARDLEAIVHAAIGPEATEQFFRSWGAAEPPATAGQLDLRLALLMIVHQLRIAGRLLGAEDAAHVLRFLDARRYAGLQFAALRQPAPAMAVGRPRPGSSFLAAAYCAARARAGGRLASAACRSRLQAGGAAWPRPPRHRGGRWTARRPGPEAPARAAAG